VSVKRKAIPKRKRTLEKARRLAAGLWRDVTGKPKPSRKGSSEANPWQRCTACHRRQPPYAFGCGEPSHLGVCASCCGAPHDYEDDEETPDQAPVRDKDDEDEGDDAQ
jgi:hypothetical protein